MKAVKPVPFTSAAEDEYTSRQRDPQDFVRGMDDEFLSCRADRHSFPKLRPGPPPKGVRIAPSPQRDGSFQLTYTCPDCGTRRTRTTLPGGTVDRTISYDYRYPPGYQSPKGAGLTKADFSEEMDRRVAPWIRSSAQ